MPEFVSFKKVIKMFDNEDAAILNKLKRYNSRRKKNFHSIINRKEISDEELDELFLSY